MREAQRRVFVTGDTNRFHASFNCVRVQAASASGVRWCEALAAYASCLEPCKACAEELFSHLRAIAGAVPSGERRRRGLPALKPLLPETSPDELRLDDPHLPYGAPRDNDDLRFSVRSQVGWGTNSYGQNPEEFLAEGTDDDNDWRGGARFMD